MRGAKAMLETARMLEKESTLLLEVRQHQDHACSCSCSCSFCMQALSLSLLSVVNSFRTGAQAPANGAAANEDPDGHPAAGLGAVTQSLSGLLYHLLSLAGKQLATLFGVVGPRPASLHALHAALISSRIESHGGRPKHTGAQGHACRHGPSQSRPLGSLPPHRRLHSGTRAAAGKVRTSRMRAWLLLSQAV